MSASKVSSKSVSCSGRANRALATGLGPSSIPAEAMHLSQWSWMPSSGLRFGPVGVWINMPVF
ncbi:hypothetical protein C7476_13427 [Phyllobacterium bourgognense]|uniref:Uncharacterized protein n=1 Tax=Phyllobacterium bourgognense TaxID=314236 RepID=A0A368YI97_9HYPH|nr:hypothetical protein C7476_13427 [Phyllobacterium bourgognense]